MTGVSPSFRPLTGIKASLTRGGYEGLWPSSFRFRPLTGIKASLTLDISCHSPDNCVRFRPLTGIKASLTIPLPGETYVVFSVSDPLRGLKPL